MADLVCLGEKQKRSSDKKEWGPLAVTTRAAGKRCYGFVGSIQNIQGVSEDAFCRFVDIDDTDYIFIGD